MSAYDAVVVTVGPGGGEVARALAARGQRVVLLRHLEAGGAPDAPASDDPACDDPAPDIPLDTGVVSRGDGAAVAALGSLAPFTATRSVLGRGRRFSLPLAVMDLPRLIPGNSHPYAIAGWVRARATSELAQLIGGGSEQRTYRDWVVQHYGAPAWEHLYASYVAKRFGPADEVICGVARIHHGVEHTLYASVPGASVGGEAVTQRRVRVKAVGEGAVETDQGTFRGGVWLNVPPRTVCGWLGEALPVALTSDAERMTARVGLEVVIEGGAELPFETHLLDGDIPYFRLVRPGLLPGAEGVDRARVLVAHAALDAADPRHRENDAEIVSAAVAALQRAGVADVRPGRAIVRRLPDFHPVWRAGHLTRLRGWVLAMEARGLAPVGRLGLCAPIDAGVSATLVARVAEHGLATLREAVRVLVEPPVTDPPERAALRRFLTL